MVTLPRSIVSFFIFCNYRSAQPLLARSPVEIVGSVGNERYSCISHKSMFCCQWTHSNTQHIFVLLYIVDGEIVPTDSKTSAFGYRRVYVQMQTFLSFQSATKFAEIAAVISVSRVTLQLNTFAQVVVIIIVVIVGVISMIPFVEKEEIHPETLPKQPPTTHARRVPLTHW